MRDVKYRMENYLLFDYIGVERHLSDMAAKGWRLEGIGAYGIWKYRRAVPKKITYEATYVPECSEFNPQPTEGEKILADYCMEAGWEKVTDWNQMQIFSTEKAHPISIETDESVRLGMIRDAMTKTFLPVSILMFVICLFQLLSIFDNIMKYPGDYLSKSTTFYVAVVMAFLTFQTGNNLINYCLWIWRSQRSIAQGGKCAEIRWNRKLNSFLNQAAYILLIPAIVLLYKEQGMSALETIVFFLLQLILVVFFAKGIQKILKKNGSSKEENFRVTMVATVIIVVFLTSALRYGVDALGIFDESLEVYETNGMEVKLYHDELPLKVEDLREVTYEVCSSKRSDSSSILMSQTKYYQTFFREIGYTPSLSYDILKVKVPLLFDWCLERYLDRYHASLIEEKEGEMIWDADKVFYAKQEGRRFVWLICRGDYIVKLEVNWELTKEQIGTISAKLLSKLDVIESH